MKQGKNTPIIINLGDNSKIENLNITIGNDNRVSQGKAKRSFKKITCFCAKLKNLLVKFITEIDVDIISTLLAMIFTLIK